METSACFSVDGRKVRTLWSQDALHERRLAFLKKRCSFRWIYTEDLQGASARPMYRHGLIQPLIAVGASMLRNRSCGRQELKSLIFEDLLKP